MVFQLELDRNQPDRWSLHGSTAFDTGTASALQRDCGSAGHRCSVSSPPDDKRSGLRFGHPGVRDNPTRRSPSPPKGERGRGTLAKDKPRNLGTIKRTNVVSIWMLENLDRVKIGPLIEQTSTEGSAPTPMSTTSTPG